MAQRTLSDSQFDLLLNQQSARFLRQVQVTPGVPVTASLEDRVLYVRSGGDDTADGLTEATALATSQEAVDRLAESRNSLVVDLGPGSFPGFHLTGYRCLGQGSLVIRGATPGAPALATGTTSGTATGGNTISLVDSGQAWTVGDLVGKHVLVGGEYRAIWDNTADTLYFERPLSASASGKAYSITEPKTILTGTEPISGYGPLGVYNCMAYRSIIIQDLKIASGVIGAFVADSSGIVLNRIVIDGPLYGLYAQNLFGNHRFNDLVVANATQVGFTIQNVSNRVQLYGSVADTCKDGYQIVYANDVDLYGAVARDCTRDGFFLSGCNKANFNNRLVSQGNTRHGVWIAGSNKFVDVDSCSVTGNGGYGFKVDENAQGNRAAYSVLNMAGTMTVANNTLGGIIGLNHSVIALSDCGGTGNGGYGLRLESGSTASITGDTDLTGSSGDATIDDGATALVWATNFASDGDSEINSATLCLIERKD